MFLVQAEDVVQIGGRRTNHNRDLCYKYDCMLLRFAIVNKTCIVLFAGGSGNYTGKGKRGKAGKQKKPKEEEKRKNNLVQMAESMAESLQSLNARIEEQQRQQQLCNGHGASANGVSTNEKSSSRKEDGHK